MQSPNFFKIDWMTSKSFIGISFIISHLVLMAMFIFTFPSLEQGLGRPVFDLQTFGYSEHEAREMLKNLEPAHIKLYLFPQLFFLDILYPLFLALFLSACLLRLSKLSKVKLSFAYFHGAFLPFLAMLADYGENLMIAQMLLHPAEISASFIQYASLLTQLKGLFTSLTWLIILGLFLYWQFKAPIPKPKECPTKEPSSSSPNNLLNQVS